ncbi:MAG TPA: RagB/SusD family nutrient uptake outer membrane protein [Longimicrobiaceae bacterium]|nr:RagB/SusD family nutrient uptake outer membrane protein [Longimicrobiaceae bacterium]
MLKNRRTLLAGLLLGGLALGGCELNLQDPNRPTEEEVFNDPDGVQALAVGLQAVYSDEVRDPIWVNALLADELGAGLNSFAPYADLDAGRDITRGYYNTSAFDPWTGQYRVIKLADDLLRVAAEGPVPSEGTRSGMLALARLYKAMALGNLIQLYESVPLDVGVNQPAPFQSRQVVLVEILNLLESARSQIQATPPSQVFNQQILAPGFSLQNTIDAMIARYALIAGNNQLAIQAAQRVSPSVLSTFQFSATDPNPLWELWYNSGNAYQMRPEQAFRLQAEAGDQRVAFWVRADTIRGANARLDELARYRERTEAIPVYFPDEMKLIQAEAYARLGQLAEARTALNAVRTQCTSALAEPVACLPALTAAQLPTAEAILAEVLRQRRYELYLQGLAYEDRRRLGATLKYPWILVPQAECDRNPAATC